MLVPELYEYAKCWEKKHGQHIVFISIKTITLVKRGKKPSHCDWS